MGWLKACPLFTFPACFDVSSHTTKRLEPLLLVLLAIATKMSSKHCLTIHSWQLMEPVKLGSVKFMLHEITKSLVYKAENHKNNVASTMAIHNSHNNETQGCAGNTETHLVVFVSLYRLGSEAAIISFGSLFP